MALGWFSPFISDSRFTILFGNGRLHQGRPLMPSAFPIADRLLSSSTQTFPNSIGCGNARAKIDNPAI
jgi:hypothetical protein